MSETAKKIDKGYVSTHVELVRLLRKGEGIQELLAWDSSQVLLRWLNHHLYRAKRSETVSNLGSDLKDSAIFVHVFCQILPKESVGLADILAVADLTARASKLLEFAKKVNINANVKAEDISSGNTAALAEFTACAFFAHPAISLPSEKEVQDLFNQLDGLRAKLRDCNEHKDILKTKIGYLERDISDLRGRTNQNEDAIKKKQEELNAKTKEYDALVSEKDKEIAALEKALKEIEEKIAAKKREIEEFEGKKGQQENDQNTTIANNKAEISRLEGEQANLKAAIENLQELATGEGANEKEMEEKLRRAQEEGEAIVKLIEDYISKSRAQLEDANAKGGFGAEFPVSADSGDERSKLADQYESQKIILSKLAQSLEDKRSEFAQKKAETKKKVDDINRVVAEYIGDSQANTEDAIANVTRLLELLTDKCNKQAQQIKALETTIEKKDQMNDLMAEKILQIAEESMKPKVRGKLKNH